MEPQWMLLPLAILYGGLLGTALAEWTRYRHTHYQGGWVWLLIILIFSLLGPAAYLFLVRKPE